MVLDIEIAELFGDVFGASAEERELQVPADLENNELHVLPDLRQNDVPSSGDDRCTRWANDIVSSKAFRRRIIHYVIPAESEEGPLEIYLRLV